MKHAPFSLTHEEGAFMCETPTRRMPMGTAEHPAINAAREIRQLHLDNIKMIDDGFVFHDKDGNSVNDTMRAACQEQIALCDNIIDVTKSLPPELLGPVELMLVDVKASIATALDDAILPEIGNYDNDEA